MTEDDQQKLDQITDTVMAYNPQKDDKPLKVIAGTPDKPLVIGGIEIPCYVLENEVRVLSQRGLSGAIGLSADAGSKLTRFTHRNAIKPFINNELMLALNSPYLFDNPTGGGVVHGYPATLLVDLCNAVHAAQEADALLSSQSHIAHRCDTLIRGLAKVGIIALVDEATGYQEIRAKNALAEVLERYLAQELRPWAKMFPLEYYEEICRLKKWRNELATKRPAVIGKYTNNLVYERLAPGVFEELRERNPVLPATSRRKNKHHQWLTEDHGSPKLREHLLILLGVMKVHDTWDTFMKNIDRALPKQNLDSLKEKRNKT